MSTNFAEPKRVSEQDLCSEIARVNQSPVVTGLLQSISGLLAVLDEHRQIIAFNDSFMKMLGIADPSEVLGLRPGEALHCIHAHEEPAGCGTTKFCSSCGAAIAIVASLKQDASVERMCALTAHKADRAIDMALLVRSSPLRIDSKRFLLLFLQDISLQQERAALEKTFFHDIKNMLTGLVGASDLLASDNRNPSIVEIIRTSSLRMLKEIEMQRSLLQDEQFSYQTKLDAITPETAIKELSCFFVNHAAAKGKKLFFSEAQSNIPIQTDLSVLLRVLSNMVTNALEATETQGTVKVWFEQKPDSLCFCVWNKTAIEKDAALRIFQRNFRTKNEAGRGIGTFSMKLFGEKILGGKVSFTSCAEEGTIFKISLPV